jgi:ribonuclease HI
MLPDKLDLYFDGSCGPNNPGGTAGYAWRLVDPDTGKVLAQDCGEVCRGPTATNNIGEWGAVKAGLEHLAEKGWKGELNIRGDSQLVIYQLIGKYKCRKDTLIPFYEACMLILGDMQWDAHWIPREQNDECDRMSKQAYAAGGRSAADIR